MGLFNRGDFTLHSGQQSDFLIDCEALTDEDLAACAKQLAKRVPPFHAVEGIPRGGLRLAEAMKEYASARTRNTVLLIVDDVATSGHSIREAVYAANARGEMAWGAVLFRRGPGFAGTALFDMAPLW